MILEHQIHVTNRLLYRPLIEGQEHAAPYRAGDSNSHNGANISNSDAYAGANGPLSDYGFQAHHLNEANYSALNE